MAAILSLWRIACGDERMQERWIPGLEPGLPIWVRFLATPEIVLAAILGGVLILRGVQIARLAAELGGSLMGPMMPRAESLGRQIASSPALAAAALVVLAAGGYALYRIGLEMTSPRQI